jgi:hypothetical protein
MLNSPTEAIKQLAVWRDNLDPFRLNAEFALLIALWVNVRWLRASYVSRFFRWFLIALYLVALCYYVYESVMRSFFQVDPVFYSHYRLIMDGIQFVMQHLEVPTSLFVAGALALVTGFVIIVTLIRAIIVGVAVERLSRWSKISMSLIALLTIVATLRYQEGIASPQMVVSSLFYKLEKNIHASIEAYRDVLALRDTALHQAYRYSGYDLNRRPNIYLIFVESYGSVLYKRQDYREAYTSLLSQLQTQLYQDGWYAASTLSEAPVWGGGSWMSYTSALFGIRIDTHPQFLSLLDTYQTVDYPDLGHYLKSQGYEYVRLSSLSDELKEEDWLRYKTFYGVDRWLRYRDLDYQGSHYGWGPAPPDQYALNFAQDAIASDADKPVFFFFITQNSHYPWVPLPAIVDNWRTLNVETTQSPSPPPEASPHEVRRANYLEAIKYQLRFLTDFILKTGDENSIFVLIGDHQPQRVSRHSDGFETPIHIISKDATFVDAFLDSDFVNGLEIQEVAPTMRHEGFYSMFMRVLLAQYGQGIKALPDYLPGGITLDVDTNTETILMSTRR